MKIGHTVDSNGFLTGDVVEGSGVTPSVTAFCPDGFYKPKWNGAAWEEGLTQAEIDAISHTPKPPSLDERIKALEDMELERMLGGL